MKNVTSQIMFTRTNLYISNLGLSLGSPKVLLKQEVNTGLNMLKVEYGTLN